MVSKYRDILEPPTSKQPSPATSLQRNGHLNYSSKFVELFFIFWVPFLFWVKPEHRQLFGRSVYYKLY